MSSPKFERVKQQHPSLSVLLDALAAYIRAQLAGGQQYIVPKLAAAALRLNDGEAFVLLNLLAEGGVLRRVYNVYCRKENALLGTADNLDDLDKVVLHCDFCDTDHDPSNFKIEVAFSPANSDLRDLAA